MVPRSVPRNTPGNAPRNRFLEPFAKITMPSSQVSTCFGGCYWAPYQAPVSGRPQHCLWPSGERPLGWVWTGRWPGGWAVRASCGVAGPRGGV